MSPQCARTPAGRPPRRAGELLSKNRTFRVRPQLDEQLTDASLHAGRSVSEEIELRLERSFTKQETVLEALDLIYGPENIAIAMVFAELAHGLNLHASMVAMMRGKREQHGEPSWLNDPFLFNEFAATINIALEAMRPEGSVSAPSANSTLPVDAQSREIGNLIEKSLQNLGQREIGKILSRSEVHFERTGWAALVRDRISSSVKTRLLEAAKE